MKRLLTVLAAGLIAATSLSSCTQQKKEKEMLMWMDLSANWLKFTIPDTLAVYLDKTVECGFNTVVVDVKNTNGHVAYRSRIAPQMVEWKGRRIPDDYDYLAVVTKMAHERGLKVYAAFNEFAEGNGFVHMGPIYNELADWQTISYEPGAGLVKNTEIPGKQVCFLNPALPQAQAYEQSILAEVVANYDVDGVMLDRCRYDNIKSDFSDFSKELFEAYAGQKVERFPEDIYEWVEGKDGKYTMVEGPLFKLWLEWRASVVYNYFKDTRALLKGIRKDISFAAYTGAWYPSYYEVGVNWASKDYDPSEDFEWATPKYKEYALADLLDLYTNGNYYWNVTLDEYNHTDGYVLNETDSKALKGNHLCVEGGCKYSRMLMGDHPFIGGMYVETYEYDAEQFKKAVKMNIKESDGFMLFDIVHIIIRDWFDELKEAVDEAFNEL